MIPVAKFLLPNIRYLSNSNKITIPVYLMRPFFQINSAVLRTFEPSHVEYIISILYKYHQKCIYAMVILYGSVGSRSLRSRMLGKVVH